MHKTPLFLMVFSCLSSATSIDREQLVLTHENANQFNLSVKNQYTDPSKVCTTITINKSYKKANQLGFFLEVNDNQKNVVFSGMLAGYPNENSELIDYHFCYRSKDVVSNSIVTYGYRENWLATAYIEISHDIIAP
ncbi:hypothetical protein [Gallaecimonas xiamenensis]|uniref:hypothetical protein n=1 Tax=Gallaecimonas xiamenensis TaxID=1207039 RepID=UPI0012EB00D8|nr:hypothetical protein [Gallaecimonas xiamenensis]